MSYADRGLCGLDRGLKSDAARPEDGNLSLGKLAWFAPIRTFDVLYSDLAGITKVDRFAMGLRKARSNGASANGVGWLHWPHRNDEWSSKRSDRTSLDTRSVHGNGLVIIDMPQANAFGD